MAEVAAQHFAGNAIKIGNANQVLSVTSTSNVTSFHGLLYPAAGSPYVNFLLPDCSAEVHAVHPFCKLHMIACHVTLINQERYHAVLPFKTLNCAWPVLHYLQSSGGTCVLSSVASKHTSAISLHLP